MILLIPLSIYLAIAAAIKKRYSMVFLSFVSMSIAVLALVCNSYPFEQISSIASAVRNIALIALAATTVSVLCRKE